MLTMILCIKDNLSKQTVQDNTNRIVDMAGTYERIYCVTSNINQISNVRILGVESVANTVELVMERSSEVVLFTRKMQLSRFCI